MLLTVYDLRENENDGEIKDFSDWGANKKTSTPKCVGGYGGCFGGILFQIILLNSGGKNLM